MYLISELEKMLDQLCEELPPQIFHGLNGGISVNPAYKHNDRIPSTDYWVMGEYLVQPVLGRRIVIYYGSFMALYADVSSDEAKGILRHILHHELRHHIELMAGNHELEKEDEQFVQKALRKLERIQEGVKLDGSQSK